MDAHQVIIRPVISEKSYNLIETENQYTFQVDKRANKNQIKRAIEEAFDVRVYKVNTVNVESKPKDRKSTRLNSSHANISYAVFCLTTKNTPAPPLASPFSLAPCSPHRPPSPSALPSLHGLLFTLSPISLCSIHYTFNVAFFIHFLL